MAGFGEMTAMRTRAGSADSTVRSRIFATTIDVVDIALPHFCARAVSPADRERTSHSSYQARCCAMSTKAVVPRNGALAKSNRWDYES